MSVNRQNPVPSDIEIAQSAVLQPIEKIAEKLGISREAIIQYGAYKGKIDLHSSEVEELLCRPQRARYIDVTAITPTPLGEGKTTTAVGLTEGMAYIGKKASLAIRQPSMGPTFGIKGGAAGGGYSQVVPMEDFNLHLTGDLHAVTAAHNLCAAAIDARIYHEEKWSDAYFEKIGLKKLHIDPHQVTWRRVMDMNDRALRNMITGLGSSADGPMGQSGFDITAASELMAILALSRNLRDMRERIGRIIIGYSRRKEPVTTEDLQVAGAMTVLMKDALNPNLLQTMEEQPAFVHAGPFANIAHGNSSVVADLIGAQCSDYLITESGFGADIGMEKFFHIKCRVSGLTPHAVVLVATVRALKMHGGGPNIASGGPLAREYREEHLELLEKGIENLKAHIDIARRFGVPVVVAVNAFSTDTQAEWDLIREKSLEAGAFDAVVTRHWEKGGEGAAPLAEAVCRAADSPSDFRFLYTLDMTIKQKIEIICKEIYGAAEVTYSHKAEARIAQYEKMGYGNFPICMAKTPLSLSHDPHLKNRPRGFTFPVEDLRLSAGAGFIYPLTEEIRTMPGLPSKPAFMGVDLDRETGKIRGLF